MKPSLAFDFTVDKDKNSVHVTREFHAKLDFVWDAWTKPELLDQWWAPKPYKAKTKSMDFRVGGYWLYSMTGPEGDVHWSRADYKKIDPQKSYSAQDAFCDADAKINPEFPRSNWTNTFQPKAETTTVQITIQYESLADLEKVIQMGFKEGFSMALANLDEYIDSHKG